ncbi:RES family NAD+ phosphorylase [Thiohalorhabdus sp.]|uniref:RES family NAD+ phosphorylase n=1 Tax=Thiohalorhabdus sp. TaxID=3094134 RepID=UPI002FC3ABDC
MRVAWRITKARYAEGALSGEGGRLVSGRWHFRGSPVVYLSETVSLAAMETFVHLPLKYSAPENEFVLIPVTIPEGVPVTEIPVRKLPNGWDKDPAPESTQHLGQQWLDNGETALLKVPSSVIPRESNYLLNPLHADASRLQASPPEPFDFDPRMFTSSRCH